MRAQLPAHAYIYVHTQHAHRGIVYHKDGVDSWRLKDKTTVKVQFARSEASLFLGPTLGMILGNCMILGLHDVRAS